MEDDEIRSQFSPGSGSPASPRPVGRITVTVAAAAPPAAENALTLALPIQQVRNGGGREDCWSEAATAVLIEAWGERYLELSRGNLKQKHWKEVAEMVCGREDYRKTPKTDIQCKNRIDTVKKKYKQEKAKLAAGGGPSKWPFYDKLDYLIGPAGKVPVGIPVGMIVPFQNVERDEKKADSRSNVKVKRGVSSVDLGSSSEEESFPRKRPKMNLNSNSNSNPSKERKKSAVKELTEAIVKLGEAYEVAESSKLMQIVEMEKQRMKFVKELEMQRMQFFMKTQLEISQIKHGRKVNNSNNNNNHNSDHSH